VYAFLTFRPPIRAWRFPQACRSRDRRWLTRSALARSRALMILPWCPSCPVLPASRQSTATRPASPSRPSRCCGDRQLCRHPFQEGTRYKKPIGIYWLQALVKLTSRARGTDRRLPARLALGALARFFTYWAALPLFGRAPP
jgi:4-amino-4-deoxy-L-arabinose transferase-like glycosyltransferase